MDDAMADRGEAVLAAVGCLQPVEDVGEGAIVAELHAGLPPLLTRRLSRRVLAHDRDVLRTLACGIAGLSHTADSLSAIKFAKVKAVRDKRGLIVDFVTEGEYPCFGNNDDHVDDLAKLLVSMLTFRIHPVTLACG